MYLVLASCVFTGGLTLAGPALAQDYVSIEVWPPHPGVFIGKPYQQFTAYGVTASGQVDWENPLTDVDWYLLEYPFSQQTMKPNDVATIDENGLLTVNEGVTWGRVSVTACYPKGCGRGLTNYGGSTTLKSPLNLLLVPSYLVTPSSSANGTLSPATDVSVKKGNTATFVLRPDAGYEASAIGGDCPTGNFTIGDTSYTTGPIAGDCTVGITYALSPVVTSSVDGTDSFGSIDPQGDTPVVTGQNATFTLTPDAGYEASSIGGDCPAGSFTVGDTSYTTGAIVGDCTVVAHFTPSQLVTSSVDGTDSFGSISPLGDTPVVTGQTQTFTLTPDAGYESSSITGTCPAGSFTVGDTSYTTGAIVDSCTVVAHFTLSPLVTSSVDGTDSFGVIDPQGDTPVVTGQTQTFTLSPDAGYESSSITGTCPAGSFTVGDTSYTTGAIVDNCTVVAHFTLSPLVTSSVDGTDSFGVIDPQGDTPVVTGQTQTFTLSPDAGYESSSITGTCPAGSFTVGDTSYTTGAIVDDCTVVVHFTAVVQQYTLSLVAINDGGDGRVYSSPEGPDCDSQRAVYGTCPSLAVFDSGTVVTLQHQESIGGFPVGTWDSWTGDTDCTDGSVTMDADKNCNGNFTAIVP